MSLLLEINQASAEINKFVAQANIHQTIAPVNPAEFTSPADTLLLASRDPVIREVSVGMTGVEAVQNTVSGTPPISLPNSLGKPLKAWSVDVLPYQEGTGDPSPDNVRPIHGTDKVIVSTSGKNLFNKSESPQNALRVSVTETDTGVNIKCTESVGGYASAFWCKLVPFDAVRGLTVTISSTVQVGTGALARYQISSFRADGKTTVTTYVETVKATNGYFTASATIPMTDTNAVYVGIRLFCTGNNNTEGAEVTYSDLQFEVSASATEYTPFVSAPSQTVLTLPQTVYTGTIGSDGEESRWGEVDLGTLNWSAPTEAGRTYATTAINNFALPTAVAERAQGFMCTQYKPSANLSYSDSMDDCSILRGNSNSIQIYLRNSAFTGYTGAQIQTALTGVKLVYELVTPTTFAVPSSIIPTPTGTATTWATAEDGTVDSMEVTYYKSE